MDSKFTTPEDVYKTAQPGDMLEFNRGAYSHWGIYLGLGRVIHPQIPPQTAGKDCLSTCCSAMSGQAVNKALVQEDDLKTASNGGLVRVNNMYDGKQTPMDQAKILETAKQRLGDKKYNLLTNNCEHFANECRYGIPQSSQHHNQVLFMNSDIRRELSISEKYYAIVPLDSEYSSLIKG